MNRSADTVGDACARLIFEDACGLDLDTMLSVAIKEQKLRDPRLTPMMILWGGPDEWFRVMVGLRDKAIDGDLEVDDRSEEPPFQAPPGELAEEVSTALSHEHEVGLSGGRTSYGSRPHRKFCRGSR